MLIVFAGLPAAGKSTLAVRLAEELGGILLDKDRVRAVLFPPPVLDYSSAQDEVCVSAIYAAARLILQTDPHRVVLLDGRSYLRAGQLDPVLSLANELSQPLRLIECHCDDDTARRRLDASQGRHPAANRDFALYRRVQAQAIPLTVPRLTLDTGRQTIEECLTQIRAHLHSAAGSASVANSA